MDGSSSEGSRPGFVLVDYSVFAAMLVISVAIGLFQALRISSKETSSVHFFTGGQSMPAVPVGLSLCASFMSAVQVLGVPSEVYNHGFKFIYMCLGQSINSLLTAFFFLPVFFRLGIISSNQVKLNSDSRYLTEILIIEFLLFFGGNDAAVGFFFFWNEGLESEQTHLLNAPVGE